MNPTDNYENPNNSLHSIEWGESTWDSNSLSIRNRYNLPSGKFNKAGSGEIFWGDFKMMVIESIKKDKFTNVEIADILKTISEKVAKI